MVPGEGKIRRGGRLAILSLILLFIAPLAGQAAVYTLTDTTSGAGNGTEYTLTVNPTDTTTFSATLEADTIVNSGWYINWWQIKFDGGTAGVITSVSSPTGNWLIGNGTVDLEGFNNFPNNTWSGVYEDSIVAPVTSIDQVDDGVPLNGNTFAWDFQFTLTAPFNEFPSFQVGYFDGFAGQSENILKNRLSQQFQTQVPEPGTALLLLPGIAALAAWRRRRP